MSQFWERTKNQITILDNTMANMVIDRPRCKCNIPASIALCKISGDYFWICSCQSCSFVMFLQTRPDPNEVDFGLITPFGKAEIDRYTNLAYISRWFGFCFTVSWLVKIREQARTEIEANERAENDENRLKPVSFPKGSFQFRPRRPAWYRNVTDWLCCGFGRPGRKFYKSHEPGGIVVKAHGLGEGSQLHQLKERVRLTNVTADTVRTSMLHGDAANVTPEQLEYDMFISLKKNFLKKIFG